MNSQRKRGRVVTLAPLNRSLSINASNNKLSTPSSDKSLILKSPKGPKIHSVRSISSSTTAATKLDAIKKTPFIDFRSSYSLTDRYDQAGPKSPFKLETSVSRNLSNSPERIAYRSLERTEEAIENDEFNEEREEGIHFQQIKQQSSKIESLMKRARGKIAKFKTNADKFDEKLKMFTRLSTFIDSKPLYQEMNLLNHINVKTDYTQNFVNKINEQKNQKKTTDPQDQVCSEKTRQLLEEARSRISRGKSTNALTNYRSQKYYEISKIAEKKLQKEHDIRVNTEEAMDLHLFDNQLEIDILNGKYDYLDAELPDGDDEEDKFKAEMKHMRKLLEQGTRKKMIEDKNYAADFRARADKVTKLLKQAAVRIYHKKPTDAPSNKFKDALSSNPTAALRMIGASSSSRNVTEQMEELHQELNYVSYRLEKEHFPAVFERGQKRTNLMERRPFELAKQQSSLLQQMGKVIIDNVEDQDRQLKDMKAMLNKKIEQFEEFEEAELQKISGDPHATLKINFDKNGHFGTFATNSRRIKPSKKTFVHLFGK